MRLHFYRGDEPNFGDELNNWLMPRLFGSILDDNEEQVLLAIGSVLHAGYPANIKKIVFGAGYGGYAPPPIMDDKWHIYCVRGPRTARVLGLGPEKVAGDAAISISHFRPADRPRASRVSFVPHWQSVKRGHWQAVCRLAGIHFIDPRLPVDQVLRDIIDSSVIVCEAMHAAIVADAFRVPWVPMLPFHASHHLKWLDWTEGLDIDLRQYTGWPSSILEAYFLQRQPQFSEQLQRGSEPRRVRLLGVADPAMVALAAVRLNWISKREPTLSRDSRLDLALDRLMSSADAIKRDFTPGGAGVGHRW